MSHVTEVLDAVNHEATTHRIHPFNNRQFVNYIKRHTREQNQPNISSTLSNYQGIHQAKLHNKRQRHFCYRRQQPLTQNNKLKYNSWIAKPSSYY